MDTSSVRRTPTKRSKTKKKPIKVVYISNPMRVKTSASEFRALVQELTGQDAESPPDPSRYKDSGSDDGGGGSNSGVDSGHQTDSDNSGTKVFGNENEHSLMMRLPHVGPRNDSMQGQLGSSIEALDDAFTPQMIENISAFLPEFVFYESAQPEEVQMLRRLDAV